MAWERWETLKNLVLGGIASFTIVDGGKVEARDLGNNFLVSASNLGEPRAKVVTELLQELNESVSGSYVEEVPEVIIADNPAFFNGFDLVIATQLREQDAVVLDGICRASGRARLLLVRSYGLAAARWRAGHGGGLPATSADKAAFKAAVGGMRRTADGVPLPSENFDEALKAAFHVWTPYAIPSEAERDTAAVEGHCRRLLAALGRPADAIAHDTVRSACRHARHLRCVSDAALYVLLRAADRFFAQEAIKLVTRQFVPLAGSLVYNAMSATTTVLEL
eukprot:XP_001700345.1 predicted protein [Chlamydomonas reinhardtii]